MPKSPMRRWWPLAVAIGILSVGGVNWPGERERGAEHAAVETSGEAAAPGANPGAAEAKSGVVFSAEANGGADASSSAMRSRALFAYVRPTNAAALDAALPAPSPEIHYVRLNAAILRGKASPFWQRPGEGRLEIPLPRGGTLAVLIDGSEMVGPDRFTSTGRIEGRPASRVVFGASGGFLHASIEDPVLGAFALRTATAELAQFYRVDAQQVAPCGGGRRPATAANGLRAAGSTGEPNGMTFDAPALAATENPQRAVIHVLAVHSTAVLPTMSGAARKAALESAFLAAVEKVNVAFANSLISARMKLVRVHETTVAGDEVAGAKSGWQDEALTALASDGDGAMDEVHALRDAVGADVVLLALRRPDASSSGLSFLLDDPTRLDNANFAFSVVQYGNIAATNVVAHEFGHVLGCAHDREHAVSGKGAFPYSFGYWFMGANGQRYRDIMAYPPGIELSYFSNPNVVLPAPINAALGVPAGSPGESDTARTIEQTAFQTAQFRLQTQAAANAGALINVATRAFVGRGEQVLIGGFVVGGTQAKRLLVRGAGPALRAFGVSDALADPVLNVFSGGRVVAANDNWSGQEIVDAARQAVAFPFVSGSADAALVVSLEPGAYTAVLEDAAGGTGSGLMEVYDLAPGGAGRVVNLATRGFAGTEGREMHGGFVVQGAPGETKRILVRVLGPTLGRAPFGMSGVLDDPFLELRNAAGELLIENDDWSSDADGGASAENDFRPVVVSYGERQIFATGHAPGNRREPCVLVDLPPGSYTALVRPFELRSANVLLDQPAVPGVGIIEVYEIAR